MIERLAEGQAALWLNESLMLALVSTGIVENDRMLEAIDVVIAAKRSAAAVSGPEAAIATASLALLASISASIAAAKTKPDEAVEAARPRRRTVRRRRGSR